MVKFDVQEAQIEELSRLKRAVSYDSYDISVRQIVDMVGSNEINIAPEYQRHFIWSEERESELIESLFLGIPIPSLFMATNADGTWEVVDGVQRISTVLHFVGADTSLEIIGKLNALRLGGLKKLTNFDGVGFADLTRAIQLQFMTRPLRITTLNDKSDNAVRYDLFERLNTGAVKLHPQEIRNCVFRGLFTSTCKVKSEDKNFRKIVKLPKNEVQTAAYEECVLRFYAFRDRYKTFGHDVQDFLNQYSIDMNKKNVIKDIDDFTKTMTFLTDELPNGVTRTKRKNVTPINLYEAVAVGASLALKLTPKPKRGILKNLIDDKELVDYTTGGTNSRPMVTKRIEYVRDRLL